MTIKELKTTLTSSDASVVFNYLGQQCGIESSTDDDGTSYAIWFGLNEQYFDSFSDAVNTKMFHGESLVEIVGEIQ